MKFTIVVQSAPYSSPGSISALRFCQALISEGQEIFRVFFFREGARNADAQAVVPQDEVNVQQVWQEFLSEHSLDAVVCVSSALRHGVLDQREAARHEKAAGNLLPAFEISGLGQLVDACRQSDRVITFG